MKIVWDLEKATVRDVYEKLLEAPQDRLHHGDDDDEDPGNQGPSKEDQEDRAYVYRPSKPKQQVIGGMVREFINRVFNGSAEPLLVHLVEDEKLTEQDLAEIARLARRKP